MLAQSIDVASLLQSAGNLGALIVLVLYFLKHLRERDNQNAATVMAIKASMDLTTRELAKLSQQIERLIEHSGGMAHDDRRRKSRNVDANDD